MQSGYFQCAQNNNRDREGGKVLLEREISIHRYEYVESFRCEREQFSVLNAQPTHFSRRLSLVTGDDAREAPVNTLIDEYLHDTVATRRSLACSRNSIA